MSGRYKKDKYYYYYVLLFYFLDFWLHVPVVNVHE